MLTRRSLFVLPALLAAPAIVRAASLMKVKPVEPVWVEGPGLVNIEYIEPFGPSVINRYLREQFAVARLYRESLDREIEVAKRYMG